MEGPGLTLAFQGSMRLLVNMETEIHSIEHIVDFMLGQYTDIWDVGLHDAFCSDHANGEGRPSANGGGGGDSFAVLERGVSTTACAPALPG